MPFSKVTKKEFRKLIGHGFFKKKDHELRTGCGGTRQFWGWQRCGCWTQIELEFGNIDV